MTHEFMLNQIHLEVAELLDPRMVARTQIEGGIVPHLGHSFRTETKRLGRRRARRLLDKAWRDEISLFDHDISLFPHCT